MLNVLPHFDAVVETSPLGGVTGILTVGMVRCFCALVSSTEVIYIGLAGTGCALLKEGKVPGFPFEN